MNRSKFFALSCLLAGFVVIAATQAHATVVRFRLSYGSTFFGDVDVQLYDADKPITVSNFLARVQSHAYDNSILHDCRPGFTLQGGVGTVDNPFSPDLFDRITRISTNGPIPNEYAVGPHHGNVAGTLAMAKPSGNPDGATSSWFFNLGNNTTGAGITNLDTANGGFTVFGTVIAGMNVLEVFNTFSADDGIVDMFDTFHSFYCPPVRLMPDDIDIAFDALPVGYYGLDCPRFNDLYSVQVFVLPGSNVDKTVPKVAITSPAKDYASVSGANIMVTGTASDNIGLSSVRVYLNNNAPVTATGTTSWALTLNNVPAGTNRIVVEAIDTTGNRAQSYRRFFKSVLMPLNLDMVGNGTISGRADGDMLEVGRGYAVEALPADGYLFAAWTGTVSQTSRRLPFIMESNMTLTAIFPSNPFPAAKGAYNGIFYNAGQAEQHGSGALNLTLGQLGSYSAKLRMNGRYYRFRGVFAPDGKDTNFVSRTGTNALLIRMAINLAGGSDQITGSITNNQLSDIDLNASWSAALTADRTFFSTANPCPWEGRYTLILPPDPASAAGPDGDSFGLVRITRGGRVTFAGQLADLMRASQSVPLSKGGIWGLYATPRRDVESLVSWVTFDTNQLTTDFSGLLNWFRQSQPMAAFYSDGFTNEATVIGSRFIRPETGPVLDFTAGIVSFSGGNLSASFTNDVTVAEDGRVQNGSGNDLSLVISKSTGLFHGSVTPPAGGDAMSFRGAAFQKQAFGAGFLRGSSLTGRVLFQED